MKNQKAFQWERNKFSASKRKKYVKFNIINISFH